MQVPNHNLGKFAFSSLAYISKNRLSNHNLNTFVSVYRENNRDTNEIYLVKLYLKIQCNMFSNLIPLLLYNKFSLQDCFAYLADKDNTVTVVFLFWCCLMITRLSYITCQGTYISLMSLHTTDSQQIVFDRFLLH